VYDGVGFGVFGALVVFGGCQTVGRGVRSGVGFGVRTGVGLGVRFGVGRGVGGAR